MSAEEPEEGVLEEAARDEHPTRMAFGKGGFPWYVVLAWAALVVAYTAYYLYFGVPELRTWLGR